MIKKIIFEWDEEKRQEILTERDLDIAELAPEIIDDPFVKIEEDNRKDYGEIRYRAFGIVRELRLCLVFTYREKGEIIRLITIFKVNEKDWEKHYGKENN